MVNILEAALNEIDKAFVLSKINGCFQRSLCEKILKNVVEKWNNSNSQENAEAETQPAVPTNNGSTSPSEIAESMEAVCFPEPGEFIMPRESWLKEWCRQLRTCR